MVRPPALRAVVDFRPSHFLLFHNISSDFRHERQLWFYDIKIPTLRVSLANPQETFIMSIITIKRSYLTPYIGTYSGSQKVYIIEPASGLMGGNRIKISQASRGADFAIHPRTYLEMPQPEVFMEDIRGLERGHNPDEKKKAYLSRILCIPPRHKSHRTKARYWRIMLRLEPEDLWELFAETPVEEGLPGERILGFMLGIAWEKDIRWGRQAWHARLNATSDENFQLRVNRIEKRLNRDIGISSSSKHKEYGYDPCWAALADSLRREANSSSAYIHRGKKDYRRS